jgi:hypothetical protein
VPPQQQAANEVARRLRETAKHPRMQILRIIECMGMQDVEELLAETERIEEQGGLFTNDGQRRRTRGGVFFALARARLMEAERFDELRTIFNMVPRRKPTTVPGERPPELPAQPAPPPPVTWPERGSLIEEADKTNESGKVDRVKVTLIGKPGKVIERQGFVLLTMQHDGTLPSLPKGIPVPDEKPTTKYVVYIGNKQWRRVREATRNPEDVLIVEGTQIYDAPHQAIAVFATNCTTKLLQQAQREQQKQQSQQA